MYPQLTNGASKMRVVLPVCERDCRLMLHNLDWQYELDGRKDYDCVLCADGELSVEMIAELERAAWRTYAEVNTLVYPTAPHPQWPHGPNWAFQQSARYMQAGARPWFWMEPDCTPLRPGWLDRWNHEYNIRKKAIMGVLVPGMGHCNGTAVYPANFPKLSPKSMTCTSAAWDGVMREETIRHTHDASDLMCHVWGIDKGQAKPFGGEPAHFSSYNQVEAWVNPRAILFHRAKDPSLIERLREKYANGHFNR